MTHLLVLLFISAKHQNMSWGIKVMECTRFELQGRQLKRWELSLLHVTCLLVLLLISTKIILSETVWVILCRRFWLNGRQLQNKDSESCLSWCDTPTGPSLHLCRILSYYLKQCGSYGLHKILASGEITTKGESESCLSCMGHTSSSFLPNIIKICLRVSK